MLVRMNRRDHYLPQSYLRGFVDPSRLKHQQPLWHFDIPNSVWSEKSPREVGYRLGFYDFATSETGLESADTTRAAFNGVSIWLKASYDICSPSAAISKPSQG